SGHEFASRRETGGIRKALRSDAPGYSAVEALVVLASNRHQQHWRRARKDGEVVYQVGVHLRRDTPPNMLPGSTVIVAAVNDFVFGIRPHDRVDPRRRGRIYCNPFQVGSD